MRDDSVTIPLDEDWQTTYASQVIPLDAAACHIHPGQRVFVGTGCGEPQQLVAALTERHQELVDIEIVHLLTMGEAPYARAELKEHFRVNSFFIASNVRDVIQEGFGAYTPIFLSDIPRLFGSGQLPLDVALIQVSPPDKDGFVSLGISVDIVRSAAENASLLIAEVNPDMPRTMGNSLISVQDIDWLVPIKEPLIEIPPVQADSTTHRIGGHIASLIEDGSTLELGIGRIPQAVLEHLDDKKDLGIHTEMFTDALIPLIESGVINGQRKSRHKGKVVASFCMGTAKMYQYLDQNSDFAFYPTEYVNDPFVISQQHKQVAINVALEVDLTGQVCADSLGTSFYSGIGGQLDFNRGAAGSKDGKAIIALASTAKEGSISRIVSRLSPGGGVVTTRGDVHYVTTEFGVAYLHGKSVQERAIALISIAHPDFREKLMQEAIEAKYLSPEMTDVEGRMVVGPLENKTSKVLEDGTLLSCRPIHPTDLPRMKDLFYALSQETLYYRFMSRIKHLPYKQIQNFVYVDHRTEVAIVVTLPEAYGEEIIAIGRYYLDEKNNVAEIAFVVQDKWQNRGIGTFLLNHLTMIAKRNGISGFTAEVLQHNHAMLSVFRHSEFKVTSSPSQGVISIRMDF